MPEQDVTTEIWKPFPRVEDRYEVSSFGRIRKIARLYSRHEAGKPGFKAGETILKKYDTPVICNLIKARSYLVIHVKENRKDAAYFVHRIVAEAFLGVPIPPRIEVNHKDADKYNNRLENLEYVTRKENFDHARWRGLQGLSKCQWKLNEQDVVEIRRLLNRGLTGVEIAKQFNVSTNAISDIRRGYTWKHVL